MSENVADGKHDQEEMHGKFVFMELRKIDVWCLGPRGNEFEYRSKKNWQVEIVQTCAYASWKDKHKLRGKD